MDDKHINELQKVNTKLAYFETGIKYDKSFYVNDWVEIVKIISSLFLFWGFFGIIFWGQLSLQTCYSALSMWINVGLLIAIVLFVIVLLVLGSGANKTLKRYEHYMELIMDKESMLKDQAQKENAHAE